MKPFRLTPSALADLEAIWAYSLSEWGEARAVTYLRRLENAFGLLAERSLMGAARPEIAPELRSHPVGSHVIYYLNSANSLTIIRILHGRMDPGIELRSE